MTIRVKTSFGHIFMITAAFAAVVFICGCERKIPAPKTGYTKDSIPAQNIKGNPADMQMEDPKDLSLMHGNEEGGSDVSENRNNRSDASVDNRDSKQVSENEKEQDISLIMAGDILLHIPVDRSCMLDDGSYDYSCIFENTRDDIEKADLALVNQEVIIGGKELGVTGYPSFNAPFEIGDALADSGFDVVCHATNHALDRGKTGIVNCLDYWNREHPEVAVIGINRTAEDRNDIYVYEKDGIRIAVLNYTYGTNGVKMPDDMPFAVDLLKKDRVAEDVRRAEDIADFTIVCPHWGTEYNLGKTTDQDNWTDIFFENGADLVLGTHPHVIEPIEWIEDEQTGKKMLVYYSLGNYVNWTAGNGPGTSNRMVGGLALVNIGRDDTGEVVVKDYGVEAIVCHLTKEKQGITVYRLADYDERLARSNEIVNQDPDFSRQYCVDLCNEVWGNKWE